MICDQCETVAHCMKHGCVPKQPMPIKDEALKLALETLEQIRRQLKSWDRGDKAITAIKQALAAPVQEPVGYWLIGTDHVEFDKHEYHNGPEWEAIYTTPPAAPVKKTVWTEAQHERAYRNSPELHKDVKSLAAFKRVAKEIASMYGIKENT